MNDPFAAVVAELDFLGQDNALLNSALYKNPAFVRWCETIADSDYDVALIAQQVGGNDTRAIYDALKAKALSLKWLQTFFNGDTDDDAKSFDGIKKRLTGEQVIEAGANGGAISLSMLDELVDAVQGQPSAIFARKSVIRAYRNLLRAAGGATPESIMIPDFGRPVIAHNGVPILPIELDTQGNEILTGDETQGTNDNTCSAYAVRFGIDGLHGIQTQPISVRDLGEVDDKPAYRTRIEHYSGIVLKAGRCAARLKGLTNI